MENNIFKYRKDIIKELLDYVENQENKSLEEIDKSHITFKIEKDKKMRWLKAHECH